MNDDNGSVRHPEPGFYGTAERKRGEVMEELKPCPFCGQPPLFGYRGKNAGANVIECQNNDCPCMPFTHALAHAEAIAAWNTRAALTRAPAPAEELVEIAKRHANAYLGGESLERALAEIDEAAFSQIPDTGELREARKLIADKIRLLDEQYEDGARAGSGFAAQSENRTRVTDLKGIDAALAKLETQKGGE